MKNIDDIKRKKYIFSFSLEDLYGPSTSLDKIDEYDNNNGFIFVYLNNELIFKYTGLLVINSNEKKITYISYNYEYIQNEIDNLLFFISNRIKVDINFDNFKYNEISLKKYLDRIDTNCKFTINGNSVFLYKQYEHYYYGYNINVVQKIKPSLIIKNDLIQLIKSDLYTLKNSIDLMESNLEKIKNILLCKYNDITYTKNLNRANILEYDDILILLKLNLDDIKNENIEEFVKKLITTQKLISNLSSKELKFMKPINIIIKNGLKLTLEPAYNFNGTIIIKYKNLFKFKFTTSHYYYNDISLRYIYNILKKENLDRELMSKLDVHILTTI